VLFEAPVAASLIGHLVSAISGGNLYRKSSFLLDALGQRVFHPNIIIDEDPLCCVACPAVRLTRRGGNLRAA
jgi:PmbA protein